MGLKFEYMPRLSDDGITYDAIAEVRFVNPVNGAAVDVNCLVDSGADDILLNAQFAEALGLRLEAGEEKSYQRIAHAPMRAYLHPLQMQLKGVYDTPLYRVRAAFLPDLPRAGLVGQRGFFENHKIIFERRKRSFELTPLPPEERSKR